MNTYRLLDSQVAARIENAILRPGSVVKDPRAPLLLEDRLWEARIDNMYANVLHDPDDGLYKCWYTPFLPTQPRTSGLCYAESSDGIVWRKPALERITFLESNRNNLVMLPCHGAGVRLNPMARDETERLIAIYLPDMAAVRDNSEKTLDLEALRLRLRIAVSPNGLDWTDLPGLRMPIYPYTQGDTHNNLLFDPQSQCWIAFTRTWDDNPHTGDGRPAHRLVARMQSPDLREWTRPVDVLRELPAESGRRQAYAMPVTAVEDGFIGFLMMWNCRDEEDTVDCELAWSRDAVHWTRVCPGQPLIPRGKAGAFDSHCLYAACDPIPESSGVLRLYYGGSDGPHGGARKGALGLARLRPEGFAGIHPRDPARRAVVVTRPVTITGDALRVTVDAADGAVRVGVPGVRGFGAARCAPVRADATRVEVQWPGVTWQQLRGRTLPLRFELDNATLYAFHMQSDA